jgi:hypothetical protein
MFVPQTWISQGLVPTREYGTIGHSTVSGSTMIGTTSAFRQAVAQSVMPSIYVLARLLDERYPRLVAGQWSAEVPSWPFQLAIAMKSLYEDKCGFSLNEEVVAKKMASTSLSPVEQLHQCQCLSRAWTQ